MAPQIKMPLQFGKSSEQASAFLEALSSGEESSSGANGSEEDPRAPTEVEDCEYEQIKNYTLQETRRVNALRVLVVLTVLTTGAIVSTLTYRTLNSQIKSDGTDAFARTGDTLIDNFSRNIHNVLTANQALSRTITTSAMTRNGSFPFVSIPAFEKHAYEARNLGKFDQVVYAPIVSNNIMSDYLVFSQMESVKWIEQSKIIYDEIEPGMDRTSEPTRQPILPAYYAYDAESNYELLMHLDGEGLEDQETLLPALHTSPPPNMIVEEYQNVDFVSHPDVNVLSKACAFRHDTVFSSFKPQNGQLMGVPRLLPLEEHEKSHAILETQETHQWNEPHSIVAHPVYRTLAGDVESSKEIVGFVYAVLTWRRYLSNLGLEDLHDITLVLRNSCEDAYTYLLEGQMAILVGEGDLHDPKYEPRKKTYDFSADYLGNVTQKVDGHCWVSIDIYSSAEYEKKFESNLPIVFTVVIGLLFVLMAFIFVKYDRFVQDRTKKVEGVTARSNKIVSSLFPSEVKDRLMKEKQEEQAEQNNAMKGSGKTSLKGFLSSGQTSRGKTTEGQYDAECDEFGAYKTQPIANLFPEVTIMFGDIVGFDEWSSLREPAQVFILLETIFHAFDEISAKRRVFKVETVGDCYVAVCGLPEPRRDHSTAMARFAKDCMYKMWNITKKLENTLGPDTGELSLRVGLHSGSVTGGVLRGEGARFQLFGDTMNTTSRMETTGEKGRIHMSQETADLLVAAGKGKWIKAREDKVYAKGKGELQTYWLELGARSDARSQRSSGEGGSDAYSNSGDEEDSDNVLQPGSVHLEDLEEKERELQKAKEAAKEMVQKVLPDKIRRLASWNADILLRNLKQIVARRQATKKKCSFSGGKDRKLFKQEPGKIVIDEVQEIITLPIYDAVDHEANLNSIILPEKVVQQCHDYVETLAAMYNDNPFHNFEHASHVTMSVVKLLSRIVAPSESDLDHAGKDVSSLHDHTYGITSDPLTQFACVLSALMHDADHRGVPNAQLVKEETPLAAQYRNQSVAEQNSVDLAWDELMSKRYDDFRAMIYADEIEMKRFRQLVVNSVMATDIVDKELKTLRNKRWDKAFTVDASSHHDVNEQDGINRKATIVIEHLIQASDVAHTMQHWHVYRKWNEKFFMECYGAYKNGRADTDPSINWYKGEIGFFDFYIIPLAKKLKNCGVFGVSSEEYLNYAKKNRDEWERRGEEVVAEMMEKVGQFRSAEDS